MLSEIIEVVAQTGMVVFVVGGMAAMGLGLTVDRIVTPLRDVRLVLLLLVANFVVVPAAAIAVSRLLPMEEPAAIAVVLIGCVAGAPFLPKLGQLAKADVGLAVGAMVLLMVTTVVYAPIVIPLAIPNATVDAFEIAQSLFVFMLLPLGLGLFVRARSAESAVEWGEHLGKASSTGLLIAIASALLLTWRDIVGAIGAGLFAGMAVILVVGLVAGWLAGLGRPPDRALLALATSQRNIAAALVVATSIGGDAVVYTLVGALLIPIILLALAGRIGASKEATRAVSESDPSAQPAPG
jgi:BASS family bile acid:Na+ symporter